MTRETADVVVIGGGTTGTSIAWQLAQRGAGNVLLLEGRTIASGATRWSSAQIRQHYTNETLSLMALRGLEFFENFTERTGEPSSFRQTGLMVLVTPQDAEALEFNVAMQQSLGIDTTLLDIDAVNEIDPRIDTADVTFAAWEPRAGYAEPVAVARAYAAAARRAGAELREHAPVTRLIVDGDRVIGVEVGGETISAGTVVLATGFRSIELAAPFGIELPLTPIRHSVCVIEHPKQFGTPHPIVSDRIAGSYFRPTGATQTLIGTTAAEEGEIDPEIEIERKPAATEVSELTRRAIARFPSLAGSRIADTYTGVYDCTPDVQPILGPDEDIDGLHYAFGMSGHGFKLAPVIAEIVASNIVGAPHPELDIDFFALSRFAQGRRITSARPYSVGTLG